MDFPKLPTRLRSRAEHLGGTRVKFHHPCGHTSVKDYGKGPVPKRMGEDGVKFLVGYWSKGGSGVHAPCPKCGYGGKSRRKRP
jgi:hypothetical protein